MPEPTFRNFPIKCSLKTCCFLLPKDATGGAENVTKTLAEAAQQSKKFDQVVIYVVSKGDNGLREHFQRFSNVKIVFAGSSRTLFGLLKFCLFCRGKYFDFVFSSFIEINSVLSLYRRLKILHCRRLVTRESTTIFDRDFGWKTIIVRKLFLLYGQQDLIICQTNLMADSLKRNCASRLQRSIKVIANPISPRATDQLTKVRNRPSGSDHVRIVWCGRLTQVKAPDRCLEVLISLRNISDTSFTLSIIGDGPLKTSLEERVIELGIQDSVEFTGLLPDPYVVMEKCDVGLVTSDVEGFPNVILEMLAAGVSGVASTACAGGLHEIPGVCVASDSSGESLAGAIIKAFDFPVNPKLIRSHLMDRDPARFLSSIVTEKL